MAGPLVAPFFYVSLPLGPLPLPQPPLCLYFPFPPILNAMAPDTTRSACMQARMLEPHVPEDLTSYIVEAYVALRAQSGQDAKNGDQVSRGGGGQTARREPL